MTALEDIHEERQRQIAMEGWSHAHDDEHRAGEMRKAAGCYCLRRSWERVPAEWPWDYRWWKPKSRREDLVRAGALIVAEIERLDRAKQKSIK